MKITTYYHEEGKSEDGELDIEVDKLYKLSSTGSIEELSEYVQSFIEAEK